MDIKEFLEYLGVFLTSAAVVLFLFHFCDCLIANYKKRRFLRFFYAFLNATVVTVGISFYDNAAVPTGLLVLCFDIYCILEYASLSKDTLSSYIFLGSATFFNHLMVYTVVYSLLRYIPLDSITGGNPLYQRLSYMIANILCVIIFILFQLPSFPTKEVKILIHSKERRLLGTWFPIASILLFLDVMIILPQMEGLWTNDRDRGLCFYTIVAEWAIVMETSSYLVLYFQAGKIKSVIEQNKLKILSDIQPLTGLLNRRAWEREVRLALENGEKGYMVMIDLDHFKEVNDNLGHQEGDNILKETADMLRQVFRNVDIIGHIGGDEFCAFLVGDFGKEIVDRRLSYLMNLRKKEFPYKKGGTFCLSMSAGYAAMTPKRVKLEDLVAAADTAMYYQKEHGRNGYTMFTEEMDIESNVNGGVYELYGERKNLY